jgi:choline dehydrogenase
VEAVVALGHEHTDDFNGERMTGVGFNHATTPRSATAAG